MEKKEHTSLFLRFKSGLGIWLCFFCAFLLPLSVFASNKGLVGHWPLSERSETVGEEILINSGLEEGITGWGTQGFFATSDSSVYKTGSKSYRIYKNSWDWGATYQTIPNASDYVGKTISYSVWMRGDTGNPDNTDYIMGYPHIHTNLDSDGFRWTTTNGSNATEGITKERFLSSEWYRYEGSYRVEEGVTSMEFIPAPMWIGKTPVALNTDFPGFYIDAASFKIIETADATPNNNNGSVLNGPTYTAGRDGKGLGEELVTNGTFYSNTTGWTLRNSSSLSVDTQQLKVSNTEALYGAVYQAVSVTVGKKYRYSVTHKGGTNTQRIMFVGPSVYNSALGQVTVAENGRGHIDFTAATSTIYIHVRNDNISGSYGLWDDFSVREIVSGQAMEFDGVDDMVSIPHSVSNTLGNTGTISLWVKANTLIQDGFAGLISKTTGGSVGKISYDIHWRGIADPDVIRFDIGDVSSLNSVTIPELDLNWHHLTFTWDSSSLYAYLDGFQVATTSQTVTPVNLNTEVKIGGDTYSGDSGTDDFFNGFLSDVRIYDRALTATEVEQLYSGSGASTASTGSLNKGLVGHWPLNTESKKSATVIADTTPHSNNGTLSGAVVRNHGYSFDGNDYLDLGASIISGNNPWTTGAWVKVDTLNSSFQGAIGVGNNSALNALWLGVNSNNKFGAGLWTDNTATDVTPVIGQWYYLTASYSGGVNGNLLIYVDGVYKATDVINPDIGSTITAIGRIANEPTSYYFNGSISDVRIYDRALSATEITNLYNGADIPGAIGHWLLSSGAGDVSGNGHNGTVSGATLIGEAASFDGMNDYITAGDQSVFENIEELSFGGWVFWNQGSNSYEFMFGKEGGYKIDTITGDNRVRYCMATVNDGWCSDLIYSDSDIPDKQWVHLFATYDGATNKMFVNGKQQLSTSNASGVIVNTWYDFMIGGRPSDPFNGQIADVRIYDRALSATEIATLYDQGHSKQKQATMGNLNKGLVGHWPLKSAYEKTGENMLTNFSFETGDMTSWTNGSADYSVVTDEVKYGKYSLKGVHDGSIEKPMAGQSFSVEIGKTYVISAWIKSDLTAGMHYLTTENAIGGTIEKSITGTTDWTFVQKTGTATTTTLNVYVYPHGYPIGTTWTDNISVKEVNLTADTTPQSNHGYVYGATVASGYTAFDGSSNLVSISDISFAKDESWSFSMWQYKPSGSASTWQGFLGGVLNSDGGYWMWHPGLMWYQDYYDDGEGAQSWGYISSSVGLGDEAPYDEWFLLSVTYNGSTYEAKAYVNGVLEEIKTITWSPPISQITYKTIGRGDNARYFEGSIAGTRIYDRSLSDREVKMLYDKGR